MRKKSSLPDFGILILRLGLAGLMLPHGYSKLMKIFESDVIKFANPLGIGAEATLGLAIFSEFFCSLLIIVGYKTKIATIPLIITMLVAAFIVHGDDPWSKQEFALVYCVGFLSLAFTGGGRFSIDSNIEARKSRW